MTFVLMLNKGLQPDDNVRPVLAALPEYDPDNHKNDNGAEATATQFRCSVS